MLSVVIPLYNKVATIERAIKSVLNQTISDFELIVVDNGSSDGSVYVVNKILDSRIQIIEHRDRGVSKARNKGILTSHSEWVAFLDADDEWQPTFLETCLRLSQKFPKCKVLATAYQRVYNNGEHHNIQLNGCPNETDFLLENYFEVAAQSDPPFCSISVMIRRDALLAIGGFPEDIYQGEDLLTWARLASWYRIAYCRDPQSLFYTGESGSMDKPKRVPPDEDLVGQELESIYHQNPNIKGLQQYIAQWHKMRASIYLRMPNQSQRCRHEVMLSKRWLRDANVTSKLRKKLFLYVILSYFPYTIRMKTLKPFDSKF